MKLKNYLLLAGAALMMVSCANDDLKLGNNGELATINIELKAPQIQTRAFAEGEKISKLQYAVYEVTGAAYKRVIDKSEGIEYTGSTNIPLQLPNGSSYTVVFWASSEENPYTVAFGETGATMTTDANGLKCNDDALDAFYVAHDLGVIKGDESVKVELKRPFAQINVGTNDYKALQDLNLQPSKVPTKSSIAVVNMPTVLDLISGDVSAENNVTFSMNEIKKDENDFPKKSEGYEYLAMAYVLTGDKATHDLTFSFESEAGTWSREVSSVPVQRNHRTNIFGSILTSNKNLTVEVKPGFEEEDENIDVDGALVSFNPETGKFVCTQPALPEGVSENDIKDKGGVYVDAEGNTQIFSSDVKDIVQAFSQASEIYFAPNITINTAAHQLQVSTEGITVHGNGATLEGGEHDISVQEAYLKDSNYSGTVNLNIYNLNKVKVWGTLTSDFTLNVTMENCTMTGNGLADTSSLVMTRGGDQAVSRVNLTLNNCYAKDIQVAVHSTYQGTMEFKNCSFDGVGIPFNIAKKLTNGKADVTVKNCEFNNCGINSEDLKDSKDYKEVYLYSAPIRIVDNEGPENITNVIIDNCKFEKTRSDWDILLMEYRTDKERKWFPVKYEVTNCGDYTIRDK